MSLSEDQILAQNFKDFYTRLLPLLGVQSSPGFTPIGTIITVMGKQAPANYLACDGSIYQISSYPELAAYFDAQFDSVNFFGGDGITTFAVPDLRGEFLRGAGTNSHTNQGNGADVGVHQDGTSQPNVYGSNPGSYNHIEIAQNLFVKDIDSKDRTTTNVSLVGVSTYTASSEAYFSFIPRPTNTSVLYCIAAKNIYIDARFDFSLDEKVIGSWVDGKPLYQKTWDNLNIAIPSSGWLSNGISLGITDIKHVVEAYFLRVSASGDWMTHTVQEVDFHDNKLEVYGGLTARTINVITLRYTKTTD